MCSPGYHHSGVMATPELGHMQDVRLYIYIYIYTYTITLKILKARRMRELESIIIHQSSRVDAAFLIIVFFANSNNTPSYNE